MPAGFSHSVPPEGGEKISETPVKFTVQRHRLTKRLTSKDKTEDASTPHTPHHHATEGLFNSRSFYLVDHIQPSRDNYKPYQKAKNTI